jgi:hypothetical protein
MRHRICNDNGLGSSKPNILNNNGKINKNYANDVLNTYFKNEKWFDYEINKNYIIVGIEPTYQFDRLKLICIHKNKLQSFISQGRANGPYGSNIMYKQKFYSDYKYKCKFTNFVEKWHKILF